MATDTLSLRSEHVEIPASSGQVIHALVDVPPDAIGRVVVGAPFAMTADACFPIAYVLLRNGFEVVRFDPRNHVGASTGRMRDFTLTGSAEDLGLVLDHVGPSLVAAVSLSGRPALRVAAERSDLLGLLLVTPVVNVRRTLVAVLDGTDYFAAPPADLPPGTRVLGHWVAKTMISDCSRSHLESIEGTLVDAADVRSPVVVVAGDDDPWVDIDEVRRVVDVIVTRQPGQATLRTISAASHEITRNPVLALAYIGALARAALDLSGRTTQELVIPRFSEIIAASRGAAR
jgi:acyl transferase